MANAKQEFLGHTEKRNVLCVSISYQDCWDHETPSTKCVLPIEHTLEEYSTVEYETTSDWECSLGTLHGHNDVCNCDEYIDDYPCDIINEF